jgi:predicted AlkP superfamily phosphohydrolase/phosphomutase
MTAELCESARLRGKIFTDLFTRDTPDLMVGVFGEPHPATHQCHVLDVPDHVCRDAIAGAAGEQPVRKVFAAVDAAIGKLVASLGPDTTVLLTCFNGLRVSYGGAQLLGDLLSRLGLSVPPRGVRARKRYRDFVPQPVRTALHRLAPPRMRAENVHRSFVASFDWSATRAFSFPWVYGGYLRVNLRGREPHGIVEPGAERTALLDLVEAEVRALRVVGSGAPAAAEILRPQERFPGRAAVELPDMMVVWNNHLPLDAVESPSVGVIENVEPGRHGSHTAEAGMFASGPGIGEGPPITGAWDIDIAPTVLSLLGIRPPEELDGKPIAALLSPIG